MKNSNDEKESIVDKIIYALFVKVNISHRIRPKEGDSLGLRLFILEGFLDIVFVLSFYIFLILMFSPTVGIELIFLGYLILFSLFISFLIKIIRSIRDKSYKWATMFAITITIALYVSYKLLFFITQAWLRG